MRRAGRFFEGAVFFFFADRVGFLAARVALVALVALAAFAGLAAFAAFAALMKRIRGEGPTAPVTA